MIQKDKWAMFLSGLVAVFVWLPGDVRSDSLQDFEADVGRLLALQAQLVHENRQWQEADVELRRRLEWLRVERDILARRAAVAAEAVTSDSQESADLLAERDLLSAEAGEWRALLRELAARMDRNGWSDSAATKTGESPDWREVLGALNTQHENREKLRTGQEIIQLDDESVRLVDVIYMGAALAFAVAPDATWAARGVPSSSGWHWEPQPDAAPAVRTAFDISRRQIPPVLFYLPMPAIHYEEP